MAKPPKNPGDDASPRYAPLDPDRSVVTVRQAIAVALALFGLIAASVGVSNHLVNGMAGTVESRLAAKYGDVVALTQNLAAATAQMGVAASLGALRAEVLAAERALDECLIVVGDGTVVFSWHPVIITVPPVTNGGDPQKYSAMAPVRLDGSGTSVPHFTQARLRPIALALRDGMESARDVEQAIDLAEGFAGKARATTGGMSSPLGAAAVSTAITAHFLDTARRGVTGLRQRLVAGLERANKYLPDALKVALDAPAQPSGAVK